mmetsp:Transcript_41945/g.125529  ORF Transcript_41945/g.125529 Transcript_41945/m.125529 type:complete len:317 (+) Transcript_41945:1027-1977(+)
MYAKLRSRSGSDVGGRPPATTVKWLHHTSAGTSARKSCTSAGISPGIGSHTCTAPRYPRSTMDPRDSTNVEWAGRITTHAMMKPARHKRVAQLTGTRRAKRGSHATQRDRAAGHRFPASCSTLSNGIAHQSHTWAKEPSCADASLTIVNTSTTSCSQHHLACRSAWRTHAGKRTTTWAAQASGAARRSQPAEIDRTAERNNSEVCGRSPASCSQRDRASAMSFLGRASAPCVYGRSTAERSVARAFAVAWSRPRVSSSATAARARAGSSGTASAKAMRPSHISVTLSMPELGSNPRSTSNSSSPWPLPCARACPCS